MQSQDGGHDAGICSKFRLFELVNLIWLREVSLNGDGEIRDESEWGILEEAYL